MSKHNTDEIEAESTPPSEVLVLSSEYFFIERVEVPTALESGELEDFAELSIEGLAPFPLDQLYWGYLLNSDETHILLYAALCERLESAGFSDLETYTWVLPDFATLHGARFAEATQVVLRSENASTLVDHPSGEQLPLSIKPLVETANPSLELKILDPQIDEDGLPTFDFETIGDTSIEGNWSELKPSANALWRADIRPKDFKTNERNARRISTLATRAIGYAAIFAVLLIALEGLLFMGQIWLGSRMGKVETQNPEVRRVEDKQSLMNKLEQVAQNELRPVGILEAANQIRINLGNTGIEYDEVVIEGTNRITIEGKANTINELNAYTESLGRSGAFTLIGSPNSITRSGKTTFTVTLDYTHQEGADSGFTTEEPAELSQATE